MNRWLIWSVEHGAWWGHARRGYTTAVPQAGRYSLAEATEIVHEANRFGPVHEVACPAPEMFRSYGHKIELDDLAALLRITPGEYPDEDKG